MQMPVPRVPQQPPCRRCIRHARIPTRAVATHIPHPTSPASAGYSPSPESIGRRRDDGAQVGTHLYRKLPANMLIAMMPNST